MAHLEFDQTVNGRQYQIVVDDPPPQPNYLTPSRRDGSPVRVVHYIVDGVEHLEYEWDRQLAADKQVEMQQASQ